MISRRTHLQTLGGMLYSPFVSAGVETAVDFTTDAGKERFLQSARIAGVEVIGHGVTKPLKARLEIGEATHFAQIQTINKELPDFFAEDGTQVPMMDSWRFNVAAYRIDRLLGLDRVAPAVPRVYEGKRGAFSWWVDDVLFEEVDRLKKKVAPPNQEDFDRQMALARVFDELIINIDRNQSNILITKDWRIALIDHSRSLNPYAGIRNKENLTRCSHKLYAALKSMTRAQLNRAVGPYLTAKESRGVLARRDRIIEFFTNAAKQSGEDHVFFS